MTEIVVTQTRSALPTSVKLVVAYLLVVGLVSLAWPFLDPRPNPPSFSAKSYSFQLGAYFAQSLMALAYIASGISIITRRPWALSLSLISLGISILSSANGFAWGMAKELGQIAPSAAVRSFSYALIGSWHLFLAFLLYRRRARIGPVAIRASA